MIPTIITTGALSWLRGRAEKLFQVITALVSLQFPRTKEGCEGTEFDQLLVFITFSTQTKNRGYPATWQHSDTKLDHTTTVTTLIFIFVVIRTVPTSKIPLELFEKLNHLQAFVKEQTTNFNQNNPFVKEFRFKLLFMK